jgi:hypothetical protein
LLNQPETGFLLSKWYLDCVDADGNLFIGYSADLEWNRIRIRYSNSLVHFHNSDVKEQKSLRQFPVPVSNSNRLTWTVPTWNIHASWDRIDPPISSKLLENDSGFIRWNCHLPKAQSNVTIDGKLVRGLGYAEKLELTIKPWNLPFHELHWGRYLSETDTIIWITWTGDEDFSVLFHNGKSFSDAIVCESEVQFNQGLSHLNFTDTIDLRKGSLNDTAFSRLTRVAKLFPGKVARTFENKWRSRGTLKTGENTLGTGWAIHEVVKWK